nr:unnamed protein product [Digitaria exilis]
MATNLFRHGVTNFVWPLRNLAARSTHLAAADDLASTGGHADRVFRALAVASLYILVRRWRAGGAGLAERPAPAEIAAAAALCASVAARTGVGTKIS